MEEPSDGNSGNEGSYKLWCRGRRKLSICPSTTEEVVDLSLDSRGSYTRRQHQRRMIRTFTLTIDDLGICRHGGEGGCVYCWTQLARLNQFTTKSNQSPQSGSTRGIRSSASPRRPSGDSVKHVTRTLCNALGSHLTQAPFKNTGG